MQMQLFSTSSSSSPKPQFSLFPPSQNPNRPKFFPKFPIKQPLPSPLLKTPLFSSKDSAPSLEEKLLISQDSDDEDEEEEEEERDKFYGEKSPGGLLVVRRPVLEFPGDDSLIESGKREEEEEGVEEGRVSSSSSSIEFGLSEIAKKMPMFEPERVDAASSEKPLAINLELALYRAKVLARKFRFEEAEKVLKQVRLWNFRLVYYGLFLCLFKN